MKNIYYALVTLLFFSLAGCGNIEQNYGNVCVYFAKSTVSASIKSTWFEATPDQSEAKDTVIRQIGLVRSGIREEMDKIDVNVILDWEYANQMMNAVGNPEVEQTEEVLWFKWKKRLPDECYTLDLQNFVIPEGERLVSLPIMLHKDKMASLDPEMEYFISFKLESASVEINQEYGRVLFAVKIEKELLEPVNIAIGKKVSASASSGNYKPEYAVDGIIGGDASRWFPETALTKDHWLEIDLGTVYEICGMRLWTGYGGNFNEPLSHFSFQIWNETLQDWEDVFIETTNSNPKYEKIFRTIQTSKVRLYIFKDAKVRLYEVEVLSRDGGVES